MLGRCSYTAQNEWQLKVLGVDDEVAWGKYTKYIYEIMWKEKRNSFDTLRTFPPSCCLIFHATFYFCSCRKFRLNWRIPATLVGFFISLSLVYSTRCRIVSLVVARFAQCISWWMGRGEGRGVGIVDLFSHTHFATLLLSLLSSLGSTFCPAQIPESASPATPHTPPPFTHPLSQHSVSFPAKFSLYTLFFSCTFLFRVRTKFNTLVVTCVARFFTYF